MEILNNEEHIFRVKVPLVEGDNDNLTLTVHKEQWAKLGWKEGTMLEIRQDEQLYKDDINEIGNMADEVLDTLRSHHDLLHEPAGNEKEWVCEKCGKSTFERG